MLTLFPKFKKRLILFEVLYVALMVALYFLKPGTSPIALVILLIFGAVMLAAAQYINAAKAHNLQLNRLYNQLDVEGFLKEYGEVNFVNTICNKFKSVQYFTCSALGHDATGEKFTPENVETPLLWIIDKMSSEINLDSVWGKKI